MHVSLLALALGCGHFRAAPHALYPGPELPVGQVALLTGPVDSVDGVNVARLGTSFALLPGCHVVVLPKRIGEGSVSGAWSADLGHKLYAFRMQAGRSYNIDIHLQRGNDGVGTSTVGGAQVTASERDEQGKTLQSIAPVRGPKDVEACQAWADGTGEEK
jgi:hypothetical protein